MNILIVEDHPFTAEGYSDTILKATAAFIDPVITKASNCEEAYQSIMKTKNSKNTYNLALLDQSLPGFAEQSLSSGSDLALLIQSSMPDCKIIMITAHTEVIVIYEIVKKIKPHGLVIKSEISPENLQQIVTEVMEGSLFQSPMVKNCIQEIWKKELMIDDNNRQILLYLSKGFKIKELEDIVNLTTSTIQKRIVSMKKAFEVTDDNGLVKEAVKQGFI